MPLPIGSLLSRQLHYWNSQSSRMLTSSSAGSRDLHAMLILVWAILHVSWSFGKYFKGGWLSHLFLICLDYFNKSPDPVPRQHQPFKPPHHLFCMGKCLLVVLKELGQMGQEGSCRCDTRTDSVISGIASSYFGWCCLVVLSHSHFESPLVLHLSSA